ncbi:MAG: hypothetical protein ACHQ50_10935 [Fimbriimonadales bacterium]
MPQLKPSSPMVACFSPPVMIATFTIEIILAIYVAVRYGSSLFRTIVVTVLVCLSSFQLAEYQVCEGPRSAALAWTKLGLVGITILPALGMHLIGTVTRRSPLIPIGYAVAAFYALTFLFLPGATAEAGCSGNYVLLNIKNGWVSLMYTAYYSLFLGLAMLELLLRLLAEGRATPSGYSPKLIALTLMGYLSFILPMAVVAIVDSQLRAATPSIMCGFALFLALLLALWITSLYTEETRMLEAKAVPSL